MVKIFKIIFKVVILSVVSCVICKFLPVNELLYLFLFTIDLSRISTPVGSGNGY